MITKVQLQTLLNSNFDLAYIYRGNARDDNGDPRGAIADYNKSLQFNPKNASAYYNLGITYERLEDYTLAIANYTKTIELSLQLHLCNHLVRTYLCRDRDILFH